MYMKLLTAGSSGRGGVGGGGSGGGDQHFSFILNILLRKSDRNLCALYPLNKSMHGYV